MRKLDSTFGSNQKTKYFFKKYTGGRLKILLDEIIHVSIILLPH